MDKLIDKNFPINSLVPKNETGALNFITKYPDFDGKDVTIAIFDSGVDPNASGLKYIPGGEVKIIERFDCSGAGDVDMTKKVQVRGDGTILGLSGRSLKVSRFMRELNEAGEYRIGLKSIEDTYPTRIKEKIVADKKLKKWDQAHKEAQISVSRALEEFDTKNTCKDKLEMKEKLEKENLDAQAEFLTNYEKKFSDVKTTLDCILFEAGNDWYAVIDITETGDLENALVVREFSKHHDYGKVDEFISVSINVHDSGNVLEIVGMCSSHGTHVASIASGYHPEDPNLNGVAPGAKIVSLTIGDNRLGSMETGTALVRAIIKVMELCDRGIKIDVINMSYGEHAHWSSAGRIGDLMNELVNRYGVVFVGSAGNHGPALCTIGTPPDISQPSLIGVGAYVSPEMMEAEYALRQKLPPNVYTWTSRDPCIDGGFGVTVCAPGAAIASVPNFTMSKAQLMNGTSMAAPHVAGAVALLISGLKQKRVAYTPYSIKQALWNTATKLDYVDPYAQGNGLLNVEKAFENLTEYANRQENQIRFHISVGSNCAKGIHIRHGHLTKTEEHVVNVEPVLFNHKFADAKDKLEFNVRLTLVPTATWVQCGSFLDLCYSSRALSVKIEPTGLAAGVHSARIKAYDSTCIERGTLFEIPITIVQPIVLEPTSQYSFGRDAINYKPNTITRDFINVPKNATWAVLELISDNPQDYIGGRFFIHTQQILPNKYCKEAETMKMLSVNCENYSTHTFQVVGENILELCIAKYWSNFGDMTLRYRIRFHGVAANNQEISMHGAQGIHRIELTSLGAEEIMPAVSLKSAVVVLKPAEAKISPLTSRDVVATGRQIFQNLLTYNLNVVKAQEISLHAPLLSTVLYESEFESQMWMLFDTNKQMLASGDAYSKGTYVKVDKGEYTVKLQVRHEKQDYLEKVSEATILVNFKLTNALSLDVYKSYNQAMVNGKKITTWQLLNRAHRPLYIAPICNEKLTKASLPPQASWLEGTIVYARDDTARKTDTSTFQYILTEGPAVKKLINGAANTNNGKSKSEEYKENLRDFQMAQLSKLDATTAEDVYKALLADWPNHQALHLALIQNIDDAKATLPYTFKQSLLKMSDVDMETLKEKLLRILELTNLVIENTDQDNLLKFYGMKADNRPDATKIKLTMDKQKSTLIDAFIKKTIAISKLQLIEQKENKTESGSETFLKDIETLYVEIGKFIDYNDPKVLPFSIWHAFNFKHNGRLLKYLGKSYEDKLQRDVLEEIQLITKQIPTWTHVDQLLSRIIVTANPNGFRPF